MSDFKRRCTICGFVWVFGQDNFHSCTRILQDSNKKLTTENTDLKQRNEALENKVERLPTISYYEKSGCTERICIDGIYFGYIDDLNQWKKAIDQTMAKNRYELGGDES